MPECETRRLKTKNYSSKTHQVYNQLICPPLVTTLFAGNSRTRMLRENFIQKFFQFVISSKRSWTTSGLIQWPKLFLRDVALCLWSRTPHMPSGDQMLDATDKILFARGAEAILQEPTAKKKKEGKILQQLEHISCCERSCLPLLTPKQKVPSPPVFADTLCKLITPLFSLLSYMDPGRKGICSCMLLSCYLIRI